jgi:hypothetical protein
MQPSPTQSPPAPTKTKLRYVKTGNVPRHVSNNGIYGMEVSLDRHNVGHTLSPRGPRHEFVSRALAKLKLVRPVARRSHTAYLVPSGQASEARFFPVTYFHPIIPWIFDAWPNLWDRIEQILRRHRVRLAFFSSRQAADHFRRKLGIDAVWLPEACNPALFDPSKPLRDRPTDVLELGRKHDAYHEAVTPPLAELGKTHLYEKVKGQIIFPTEDDMRAGFDNAKVSVCFPSSITHPARSGHVETVTLRYFESMAAKCLIVGHCPAELRDVMGFDPVVAADTGDPAGQLRHILDHVDDYQSVVDRNYAALLERGVWDVRVRELLKELEARGYRP